MSPEGQGPYIRTSVATDGRILPNRLVNTDTILAPEVPSLQPSTHGAVSRSNSRDGVEPRSSETNLYDTLGLQEQSRANNTLIRDTHGPISDNHYKQVSIEKDERNQDEDEFISRRYRRHFDHFEFKRLSEEYLEQSTDTASERNLHHHNDQKLSRCIDSMSSDYLSLSLSPIERENQQPFDFNYALRSEPPKAIEHLSAEDLQELAGSDEFVEQENATDYCYGGYKPIQIGEELANRYNVLRKLGFGHFSTVWLCKDKDSSLDPQYVAIKIVKSAEIFHCVAQDEIKLLRSIKSADPQHPGYKHIIQMVDYFQEISINGYHTCISMELMGPSLLHLLIQSDYHGIHLPGVRNILKQVLKGLVYLHNACKIIHTDIKPENILIKVKDEYIRSLVETSSRYTELGVQMPRTYVSAETWENYIFCRPAPDLNESSHAEKISVRPRARSARASSITKEEGECNLPLKLNRTTVNRPTLYISPNIEVKIADLGNACWEDHHFSANIQTKQYRALEVILGAGYSYPADMWSVGCLAFELACGEYLFNPKRTQTISSTEDHVLLICELLGGIPKYIAQRGTYCNQFFDSSGNIRLFGELHLRIWKTEEVLVDKYKWKRVDAIPFAAIVEAMIEPDPDLRLTAADALTSEWLNETE